MLDVMSDTTVWVEYLRFGKGAASEVLDGLMEKDQVVICGVVEMELLRGVCPHERSRLKGLLSALRFVEILRVDFIVAGERLCQLREKGVTVPATDALIAAVCKRHDLPLLTLDDHYKRFPEVKRLTL
ncbi:MAG: PIN domain-containing protein [Candidatus Sumerlaeota bacterium]|nr:PIN domain-containing protein [Candidatus Sumerlaeota bacterium]